MNVYIVASVLNGEPQFWVYRNMQPAIDAAWAFAVDKFKSTTVSTDGLQNGAFLYIHDNSDNEVHVAEIKVIE